MDLAFFVVNFGYSKSDYESLTYKEKAFIMKAWETKLVQDNELDRNAFLNAYANANRKKNKGFTDLWNKKPKKLDKDVAVNNLEAVMKIEEQSGKNWVNKIYKANGMRLKEGG